MILVCGKGSIPSCYWNTLLQTKLVVFVNIGALAIKGFTLKPMNRCNVINFLVLWTFIFSYFEKNSVQFLEKFTHIYIINHECASRTKFNKFKRVYSIIYRQFNYFSSFQWLKFWITESKIKILNNPNVLWANADLQRDWVFVTNWNILIFIFNFQMV